ncbi:MAG: helix-turn-helix domain-containing protein [Candidatus Berkelbacteria bacterium]|nr:helix-turn-helix domain-containing protein [Candidatus Berkelbacteria bacterium]
MRRLSGIYILGWNEKAFLVDPEVLKKDETFRFESTSAERVFAKFSDTELQQMWDDFILSRGGELEASETVKKVKKKKVATADETLRLWKEGGNIAEIAKTRKMSEKTVVGHIEDLVAAGKIGRGELIRIIPAKILPDLAKITAAFKKLNTDNLSPVFQFFGGRYSYEQLRLARMTIGKK